VCARRETRSCRYCPGSVDLCANRMPNTIVQVLGVSRNLQNIARCFVHFPTRKLVSCRDGRCDFFYAWYRQRLASEIPRDALQSRPQSVGHYALPSRK
jgi:hypothetical protein